MGKQYDIDNIIYLYEKYGTITAVAIRTGHANKTIKKILQENDVGLKPYIPPRFNINSVRYK